MKIKEIGIAIAASILLGSCGTAGAVQNQWVMKAQREIQAWQLAQARAEKECIKAPVPRDKAMEVQDCWEKIIRELVAPASISPNILSDYILDTREVAINYKNGKIDRDTVNLQHTRLWNAYDQKLTQIANQSIMSAQTTDMQRAQAMRSLSAELLMPPQPSLSQQTTCHQTVPGSVTCTTQ